MAEDGGRVLRTFVVLLPILLRWIVEREEVPDQLLVGCLGLIIEDVYHLDVAGESFTHLFVGWVHELILHWVHVADLCGDDAVWMHLSKIFCKIFLSAPKASGAERGDTDVLTLQHCLRPLVGFELNIAAVPLLDAVHAVKLLYEVAVRRVVHFFHVVLFVLALHFTGLCLFTVLSAAICFVPQFEMDKL